MWVRPETRVGSFAAGCYARPGASGHATAAPPSSVMNSRRFMSLPYLGSLLSNCCATRMMSSLR
jgi:hypothetical protein